MWPLSKGIFHTQWAQHLKQYLKHILGKKVAKSLTSVHGLDKNTDWLASFWLVIPPTWPQCELALAKPCSARLGNVVEKSLSPLGGLLFLTSSKYFYPAFLCSSAVFPSNDQNQCTGPNFFAALLPYENDAGLCFVLPFPITQWVNSVACLVSGTAGRQKETELFVWDEMLGCQLL